MIEMHISEVGFCSGHSASGVWVNERAETTVPGLYAAGDMASVPHNYMLGAFVNGGIAGATAADYCAQTELPTYDAVDVAREQERVLAPTQREDGLTPHEMEFKTRRLVNDYIQPPKVTAKYLLAQERFAEVREDLSQLVARDPHELMRSLELQSILDCADMAAAASLYRTESRWGLYHLRVDYPETDNDNWFCHTMLFKDGSGRIAHRKRPIDPYIVPVDETEMSAYHQLRIKTPVAAE
jgi:succinate dehydrogenase/fumarate reductase flavoprotein subunit